MSNAQGYLSPQYAARSWRSKASDLTGPSEGAMLELYSPEIFLFLTPLQVRE